ncbi:MAG: hypothetical protein WBP11_02995 [Dokdonella sp.]
MPVLLIAQNVPDDLIAMSFPAFALTFAKRIVLAAAGAGDASLLIR